MFLLRSARLLWQERKGKGKPWTVHRLILQCSIETRLWTQEETESVRSEKINKAEKTISKIEQKGSLNKNQVTRLTKELTTRRKLNNSFPGHPSKPLYQGKSDILVSTTIPARGRLKACWFCASCHRSSMFQQLSRLGVG